MGLWLGTLIITTGSWQMKIKTTLGMLLRDWGMTFLQKESFSWNRDPKGNSHILIDMMTTQPVISIRGTSSNYFQVGLLLIYSSLYSACDVTMLRWSFKKLKLWVLAAADRDQHFHWRSGWENGSENAVWRSNLPSHTGHIPGLVLALQLLCHSLVQDTTFLSCCPSLLPSACNRVFCMHHDTRDLSFLGQIASACVCVCIIGTFTYLASIQSIIWRIIGVYGLG
jgi:hypothetical protein